MPEVKMEFPHVIVVENLKDNGRNNLANDHELVKQVLRGATKGIISKDGNWVQSPGPWKIEKLNVGNYKIIHNWGYFNLSLSVTLIQSLGSIKIIDNSPSSFTVETYLDSKLTDMPFAFTLTKVISP